MSAFKAFNTRSTTAQTPKTSLTQPPDPPPSVGSGRQSLLHAPSRIARPLLLKSSVRYHLCVMGRIILLTATLIIAGYAFFFLFHAVQVVSYPLEVDNEEGFILAQADQWAKNHCPYKSIHESPYLVANYTPIYPLILSLPVRFGSVAFFWGRFISLLAILGVTVLIYLILFDRTRSRYLAVIGGMLFLSLKPIYSWGTLHRVDSLGLFFAVLGLYFLEKRYKPIYPALMWTLAVFTRQTLIAAPLAGLYFYYRFLGKKYVKSYIYSFVLPTAGIYLLCTLVTKGEFFRHTILYNMNDYSLGNAWFYQYELWIKTGVFVALTFGYMIHSYLRGGYDWVPAFVLLGWISSLTAGKVGSGENYLLEFCVGMSLAVPLMCKDMITALRDARPSLAGAFPMLILIGALSNFHVPAYPELPGPLSFFYQKFQRGKYCYAWTPRPEDISAAGEFREWCRKTIRGRVFSQFAGWALLTDHEVEYQPFILHQLTNEGRWNYDNVLSPIRRQEFAAVVIEHERIPQPDRVGPGTDTFGPEFFRAMFTRYGKSPVSFNRSNVYLPVPSSIPWVGASAAWAGVPGVIVPPPM